MSGHFQCKLTPTFVLGMAGYSLSQSIEIRLRWLTSEQLGHLGV